MEPTAVETYPTTIEQVQLNIRALAGEIATRQAQIYQAESIGHLIVGGELGYVQMELPYDA